MLDGSKGSLEMYKLNDIVQEYVAILRDIPLYLVHRLRKRKYSEYYSARMDRIVTRNPEWGENLDKRFQLDYLIAHGLKPGHDFLDYGCGALSAGVLFIKYLNPDRYVGVDVSRVALNRGEKKIAEMKLDDKGAVLRLLEDGNLDVLDGLRFDFIWAQSVLTHMDPDDITKLLSTIGGNMKHGGVFYATFTCSRNSIKHRRLKDWEYPKELIREYANASGLECSFMPDWEHPNDPKKKDTLARFSNKV